MPKENKRRGRREEKKRKRQEDEELTTSPKRPKTEDQHWEQQDEIKLDDEEAGLGYYGNQFGYQEGYQEESHPQTDNTQPTQEFFGLLDEEEQAVIKRAAQALDANEFEAEERDEFLVGVWQFLRDKELKVASSQSCSRFMEKLIQYATTEQLKSLFQALSGHFTYLVQHRFASHCCEALFRKAAPIVTEELITPFQVITDESESTATSAESLYLGAVAELQGNFGYLMTDSFASHSVRILLLVLSGRPLTSQATKSLLQSKKKEIKVKEEKLADTGSRAVPASFQEALNRLVQDMVGNLDSNYLRALATHPLGNPVLQLLLEIEFSMTGKQKQGGSRNALLEKLIPDLTIVEDSDSARFIRGLMFDPVGSHLLETIVKNCPGKIFKPIWLAEIRPKIVNMAKNDSAIHILARAIERLSPEDLQATVGDILPEIPGLLERSQFSIIKLLLERLVVRKLDTRSILDTVTAYYETNSFVEALLSKDEQKEAKEVKEDEDVKIIPEKRDPAKQRLSVFLQTMLDYPGPLQKMILSTVAEFSSAQLANIGNDRYATHLLQKTLAIGDKRYRNLIIPKLCEIVVGLALNKIGSHVLDSVWKATIDLQYLRERVARQLVNNETQLRDSDSGTFVWRSWMLDLFNRRRVSWIEKSKQADQVVKSAEGTKQETQQPRKTGIQAAMERHAAKKVFKKAGIAGTGANGIQIKSREAAVA